MIKDFEVRKYPRLSGGPKIITRVLIRKRGRPESRVRLREGDCHYGSGDWKENDLNMLVSCL